jgi:hypothetical protein
VSNWVAVHNERVRFEDVTALFFEDTSETQVAHSRDGKQRFVEVGNHEGGDRDRSAERKRGCAAMRSFYSGVIGEPDKGAVWFDVKDSRRVGSHAIGTT